MQTRFSDNFCLFGRCFCLVPLSNARPLQRVNMQRKIQNNMRQPSYTRGLRTPKETQLEPKMSAGKEFIQWHTRITQARTVRNNRCPNKTGQKGFDKKFHSARFACQISASVRGPEKTGVRSRGLRVARGWGPVSWSSDGNTTRWDPPLPLHPSPPSRDHSRQRRMQ